MATQVVPPLSARGRAFLTFRSLRHRDYRYLWFGMVVSSSGQWMEQIAIGWLMLQLTDSAFMVGAIYGARAAPSLLFSPVGGVVADRFDRLKMIALSQLGAAILAGTMAVLNFTGAIQVWQIFVIVFLFGSTWAFNNPARHALLPSLVPREALMNAMALSSSAFNISRIFGPAVAGVLIATLDIGGVFALACGFYVVVFLVTFWVRTPPRVIEQKKRAMVRDMSAALRYLRGNRAMFLIILLALLPSVVGQPFFSILPVFIRDVLGRDASSLAMVYVFSGIGALACTLTLASMGNYRNAGRILLLVGITFGAAVIVFGLTRNFALTLVFSTVVGSTNLLYMTLTMTLLQSMVSDEMRGRVMSLIMMQFGLSPLGSLIMGTVADVWSPTAALLIMGGTLAGSMGLAFLTMTSIRRLDPTAAVAAGITAVGR